MDAKTNFYMSTSTFLLCWIGSIITILAIYILAVTGQLYCAALFIGHILATLKEEVARPFRVIRKALDREDITLDEHERHIS